MTDEQWAAGDTLTIGLRLAGDAIDERGPRGERIVDDTLLMVLNAAEESVEFRLPDGSRAPWELVLDTRSPDPPVDGGRSNHPAGSTYEVGARSVVVLLMPRR